MSVVILLVKLKKDRITWRLAMEVDRLLRQNISTVVQWLYGQKNPSAYRELKK